MIHIPMYVYVVLCLGPWACIFMEGEVDMIVKVGKALLPMCVGEHRNNQVSKNVPCHTLIPGWELQKTRFCVYT